ncbi:MAG: glycoside hydrolase family 43 protein [Bacteroidota bacterium]
MSTLQRSSRQYFNYSNWLTLAWLLLLQGCQPTNRSVTTATHLLPTQVVAETYTNPVLNAPFADPSIIRVADGSFYAYATQGIRAADSFTNVQIAHSTDLVNWQLLAKDAMPEKPHWTRKNQEIWAPDVIRDGHTYYLYFASKHDSQNGMCLGVATSSSPEGPFVDAGAPLICGNTFECIDAQAFDDPATGKKLLYWGSAHLPLQVQELADDRLHFKPGSQPVALLDTARGTYANLIEAPYVVKRDNYYYLFYSGDNCCGDQAHYAVMVARAKSAIGPFETLAKANGHQDRDTTLLKQSGAWLAPGHNAIIRDDSGQDWIVYHAVNPADSKWTNADGSFKEVRKLLIDKITYQHGWPTIEGGSPSQQPRPRPMIKRNR